MTSQGQKVIVAHRASGDTRHAPFWLASGDCMSQHLQLCYKQSTQHRALGDTARQKPQPSKNVGLFLFSFLCWKPIENQSWRYLDLTPLFLENSPPASSFAPCLPRVPSPSNSVAYLLLCTQTPAHRHPHADAINWFLPPFCPSCGESFFKYWLKANHVPSTILNTLHGLFHLPLIVSYERAIIISNAIEGGTEAQTA